MNVDYMNLEYYLVVNKVWSMLSLCLFIFGFTWEVGIESRMREAEGAQGVTS